MSALALPPPRTPSPRVRIRAASFSFDSPPSRSSTTRLDESPFSKSTGAITTAALAEHNGFVRPPPQLRPLRTKMSDESMSDASSASAESGGMSPTSPTSPTMDQHEAVAPVDSHDLPAGNLLGLFMPPSRPCSPRRVASPPPSTDPFTFQDLAFPMYPPFLVRVVLDLYDVRGLAWQNIAEPVQRIWGVQTSSAEVLAILCGNGRVVGRRWWD